MRPSTSQKLAALKSGVELPVDPRALAYCEEPGPDERAVLTLAGCYASQRDPVPTAVPWDDQVKACEFYNSHGLSKTLDECLRIDPHSLDTVEAA